MKRFWAMVMVPLALASCGVPREAASAASANAAALQSVADDDAAIRAALVAQGDVWTHLANLSLNREPGGITGVSANFPSLVLQTAALARRQCELIQQNQDDPAENRVVLEKLRALSREASAYLNP